MWDAPYGGGQTGAGRLGGGGGNCQFKQEKTKAQKRPCSHFPDLFHLGCLYNFYFKDLEEKYVLEKWNKNR